MTIRMETINKYLRKVGLVLVVGYGLKRPTLFWWWQVRGPTQG